MTPRFFEIKTRDLDYQTLLNIKKKFQKFIIKPNKSGSSFGIEIVKNNIDFKKLINEIENLKNKLINHKSILIEELILGQELTVSTIKFSNNIKALAVTEIKTKNNFFDYKAKYSKGIAKHVLPARISKFNYNRCLKMAKQIHKILRCNSIARSDFILSKKNNEIYYLETNTQPGLTQLSLVPEQAKFMNISFEEIVKQILKNTN